MADCSAHLTASNSSGSNTAMGISDSLALKIKTTGGCDSAHNIQQDRVNAMKLHSTAHIRCCVATPNGAHQQSLKLRLESEKLPLCLMNKVERVCCPTSICFKFYSGWNHTMRLLLEKMFDAAKKEREKGWNPERHSSRRRWGFRIALKKGWVGRKKRREIMEKIRQINFFYSHAGRTPGGYNQGSTCRIWKFIRNLYHIAKGSCMLHPEVRRDQQAHLFLFKLQVKLAFWQQARNAVTQRPLHSRWFHWKFLCFPPLYLLLQLPAAVNACLSDLSLPKRTQFTSQPRTPEQLFPPWLHAALNLSRMVIHKCSFCRSLEFLQGRGSELMSFCSFFRIFRDKYCKCWDLKDSMTAALVGNGIFFPQKVATFQFVFPCWNLQLPWSQTKSHKRPNLAKHPFAIKSFSYINVFWVSLLQTAPTTRSRPHCGQLLATL